MENENLSTIDITIDVVKKKLLELKPTSAPGPDGIHPRVLKECASELSLPLSLIFQLSLTTGKLPAEWKQSNISPIFKKGKRTLAENYRPINLVSVVCKVMESILKDNIMNHLTSNNLISHMQHGFMPGRSCTSNLPNI